MNKNKRSRIFVLTFFFFSLGIGIFLILTNFTDNIIFFLSPSEIISKKINYDKTIRVGGLVKENSIKKKLLDIDFIITDLEKDVHIKYHGLLPNIFREGQGVVAKGKFNGEYFLASEILAKHDENYMPKEVVDSIKKQGLWKP